MSFIFTLIMFIIFVAVAISLYTEGLWGNALRLIDVVTSALLATNFYEPLANWLEGQMPSYKYLLDFLSIWVIFGVSMLIIRAVSDHLSKVKVRFLKIVDQVGSGVLACCVAAVMVSFITMSLHTAPLGKEFMFGGFNSDDDMVLKLAPDRKWTNFTRMVSNGAFSRSPKNPFDPKKFRFQYAQRRSEIEKHVKDKQSIRVN